MWQATDGHAVPDPKTLHLHVWRLPDVTRKIFQDIMPEIALLEISTPVIFRVCALKTSHVLFRQTSALLTYS